MSCEFHPLESNLDWRPVSWAGVRLVKTGKALPLELDWNNRFTGLGFVTKVINPPKIKWVGSVLCQRGIKQPVVKGGERVLAATTSLQTCKKVWSGC